MPTKPVTKPKILNSKADFPVARASGVKVVHYRILRAIEACAPNPATYRDIERYTGYYSTLAVNLRAESNRGTSHDESMTALGLVSEEQVEQPFGRPFVGFRLTAAGRKALAAGKKAAAKLKS